MKCHGHAFEEGRATCTQRGDAWTSGAGGQGGREGWREAGRVRAAGAATDGRVRGWLSSITDGWGLPGWGAAAHVQGRKDPVNEGDPTQPSPAEEGTARPEGQRARGSPAGPGSGRQLSAGDPFPATSRGPMERRPGPAEREGERAPRQGPRVGARGGRGRPALTLGDPAEAQDVLGPDGVQGQQLLLRNRCPDAVVGRVVGRLPPRLEPVQDAAARLLLLLLASHQPTGPGRRARARRFRVRPAHRSGAKMAAASAAP